VGPDISPSAGAATYFMLLVINDKITNATPPVPNAALEPYGINTFHNKNELIRYGILKDKVIRCPSLASTFATADITTEGINLPFKINLKFRTPLEVQFNQGNAGDYSDLVTNNVFMCGVASNNSYANISGLYNLTYAFRVGYTDL